MQGLRLTPRDGRLDASWQAVPGASGYRVDWRRKDRPGALRSRVVTGSKVTLTSLVPGGRYRVRVRALSEGGTGTGPAAAATVRGPAVAKVKEVRAVALSDRRVQLEWRRARHATTYQVERRTARGWRVVRSSVRSTQVRVRLPAGRQRLRVRAVHRAWAGKPSAKVVVTLRR